MLMQSYQLQLPDDIRATVVHKREGRRRSTHFLFFRIHHKKTLIAYTVVIEKTTASSQYDLYKTKAQGKWLKGAVKYGNSPTSEDLQTMEKVKQAIDAFEQKEGEDAYRQLF